MKTQLTRYTVNGEDFIKINNTKKVFSLKFLERLAGHKLSEHAPHVLQGWGFIRVTKEDGSYYAGEL